MIASVWVKVKGSVLWVTGIFRVSVQKWLVKGYARIANWVRGIVQFGSVCICVAVKSVDFFDSAWIDRLVATYSAGDLEGNAQNYQRFARLGEVATAVVVLARPARSPTSQVGHR